MFDRIRIWARAVKRDAFAVSAYAFSPIDLIPDFIPVLGYLDDLILVPLGIWLVVSLIPKQEMARFRAEAGNMIHRPQSSVAAFVVVAVWILGAALAGWWVLARWRR